MTERRTTTARRKRGASPAKTAQTRKLLVDAALDVFLERGFVGTRMSDIAARASLAKGTLYLYFPTKEAMFEAVLRDVISEPLQSFAVARIGEEESFRTLLTRLVVPVLRDLERTRRADVIRLVATEGARFPAIAETYRRVVMEPAFAIIRPFAARAVERGELRSDALVRFPFLLAAPGLIATMWNGVFADQPRMDAAEIFEAYLDLIFVDGERAGGQRQ